ncbi:MAG: C4-type zinc ribbon domain-containing protein, partial [Elusimicrobiota bacterium]
MRKHLLDLYEIQRVDLTIRDLEKRRDEVPTRLRELEGSATALQTEVNQLTEQRAALVKEQKGLEGLIQADSIKIRKWEQRLADIRNQREYLALSREIEGTKRQNRETEERIQEISTQRAEIDTRLETQQDRLAEVEVDCETEREEVRAFVAKLEAEGAEIKARRDKLVPTVPKNIMSRYEMVRKKRAGVGLAAVVDGSCQGCNMKLPPQLYNILQRGDTIEQCPSCSRIIFWDRML